MTLPARLVSLGCRLNLQESETIGRQLRALGAANLAVVNTCAVTREAERSSRQAIRKLAREGYAVYVTGCASEIDPEPYARLPGVRGLVPNASKTNPEKWKSLLGVKDNSTAAETACRPPLRMRTHIRGFVQIQNGCDHACSFCIIPSGRGASRSVSASAIIQNIRAHVCAGVQEIVLTGVDLTSWGQEWPQKPGLALLLRRILNSVPDLPRLRLSSLDVAELDEEFVSVFAEESRIMPYLHLSLQSGDNTILKRMKRRHNREQSIDFCARLRRLRPESVFGADLIAGFPTETHAMFQRTVRLISACRLAFLHVFPYSKRPGTCAERMPNLPVSLCRERARILREEGQSAFERFLQSRFGQNETVLMETDAIGRTRQNALVRLENHEGKTASASEVRAGSLARVRISGHNGTHLLGALLPCNSPPN